jgi:hypothetical protein
MNYFVIFFLLSLVNLDDCWQMSRDAQGTIQPDPITFPSGIPSLIDYVHSRKLKFGLYSGTQILFTSKLILLIYQIEDSRLVLVDPAH